MVTHMGYVLTHSGRQVSASEGCPSIHDVALSLSRMPRFAGQGRRWWSVLDHSLFVERLAAQFALREKIRGKQAYILRLAALLHDAHECITGDVPSPIKPSDLADVQDEIDSRIGATLFPGGDAVFTLWETVVHELDRRALLLEAWKVGPPKLDTLSDVVQHFGYLPDLEALRVFEKGIAETEFGHHPTFLNQGLAHPGVQWFVVCYASLKQALEAPVR
jgi:5'-deoxynucleotidase YfbR-like HD superfamily hydrolase